MNCPLSRLGGFIVHKNAIRNGKTLASLYPDESSSESTLPDMEVTNPLLPIDKETLLLPLRQSPAETLRLPRIGSWRVTDTLPLSIPMVSELESTIRFAPVECRDSLSTRETVLPLLTAPDKFSSIIFVLRLTGDCVRLLIRRKIRRF